MKSSLNKTIVLLIFSFYFTAGLKIKAEPYFEKMREQLKENLLKQTSNNLFIENKGQIKDMNNNPVPFVLYKMESPGIKIYITENGITYLFVKYSEEKKGNNHGEKPKAEWCRIDMGLKSGTIKKEKINKEGQTSYFSRYYYPHCKTGTDNVYGYEKIIIKDVYPGIDWVLYNSSQQGFKYDFIVHPNIDASQIKLIYEGAGEFFSEKNQIRFKNKIGEMIEGELFCYQGNQSQEIKSEYLFKKVDNKQQTLDNQPTTNNQQQFSYEVSIQLSDYNKNQPLVIDPQLTWASFCGGSDLDGSVTITTDNTGNVFIAGYIASTDFPVLNPGGGVYYQGAVAALRDCFIVKFNNAGTMMWSTYYGGTNYDQADAICADAAGNIFITGNTESNDFPTLNPGAGAFFQISNAGADDAYVLKLNNNGVLIWSTYYGGSLDDLANSICVDPSGNVIIGGNTRSNNFPVLSAGGASFYQPNAASIMDAFVLKFSNAGVRQWATYLGGSGFETGSSVCSDINGNIFFTGSTTSNNFPTFNPGGTAYFQAAVAGVNYDMFIAKFDNTSVRLWSTLYGGTGLDEGLSICTDQTGNVFVLGETNNNNFPTQNPGAGAYFQAYGGGIDAFILKFNNTGTRIWSTYYGGTGDENIDSEKAITTDNCQNILAAINTASTTMPVMAPCIPGDYYDNSSNGKRDIFISKFSNTGVQQWGTFFGGDGDDLREAIDLDINGNLFITGEWTEQNSSTVTSTTYPLTNSTGAYFDQTFNSGMDDSYIAKFNTNTISSNASATPANCGICNGTASATASGGCAGYQYLWYNSSWAQVGNTQTMNNLCPGTYQVIVRDSINCSLPDTSVVVVANLSGTVNITSNISICSGNSYTLPGGNIVNTAGTYLDTISFGSGCDSIITTNLSIINSFNSSQTASICTGNNYTLPGGGIVNTAGAYIDTLTSTGGCDSIITTTLSVINAFNISQAASICTGNNYTLPGGGTANTAGTYIDTLTSTGGCDSIITTTLSIISPVSVTQNASICIGTSYTLPSGSVVNTAGTYIDTLLASSGCDSVITTTLTINALPVINAGPALQLSCTATSGIISASSATSNATYSWSGPGIVSGGSNDTATVNAAGTYTVTVTDPLTGCTNTTTVVVTNITPLPNVNATTTVLPCNPQTGTITASSSTSNVTYNWSGPGIVSGSNTNSATINLPGIYTVTVTDPLTGCTNTTTVTVTNAPNPTANVSPNVVIQLGQSTSLVASGGTTYNWFPSTGLSTTFGSTVSAAPVVTTTYCVEVIDNNGCKDTACVTVIVEVPCPTSENLQLPNAFSPNADNTNDEFCLQGWTVCLEKFQVIIFDRWGEKVFESVDPNFCWNGNFRGTTMDAQVFVYYIKAEFENMDDPVIKKGNISLIR